jgi:hypothetical protein
MKPRSFCFSKHKVLSSNYCPNKKERKKERLRVNEDLKEERKAGTLRMWRRTWEVAKTSGTKALK